MLLGLIYTTVKNINVIFLIGYFRQKKYGIKVRLHVREQTRQCSKLTGFSVSFFSSLGITEFCRLRRAVFLGEVSWDRDRLRFCRDPALAGLSDPECSDTFLSRCSLSARFSANSSWSRPIVSSSSFLKFNSRIYGKWVQTTRRITFWPFIKRTNFVTWAIRVQRGDLRLSFLRVLVTKIGRGLRRKRPSAPTVPCTFQPPRFVHLLWQQYCQLPADKWCCA